MRPGHAIFELASRQVAENHPLVEVVGGENSLSSPAQALASKAKIHCDRQRTRIC